MHPASKAFISLALIWAYWRKTLHELSKISIEHALHVARIQLNPGLIPGTWYRGLSYG